MFFVNNAKHNFVIIVYLFITYPHINVIPINLFLQKKNKLSTISITSYFEATANTIWLNLDLFMLQLWSFLIILTELKKLIAVILVWIFNFALDISIIWFLSIFKICFILLGLKIQIFLK